MKAVIIAGGRGERLKPLTDKIPKPMININTKPILEHIIKLFKKYSITDFIITLHYLPNKIRTYFADGSGFGVKIIYIYENKPFGTAGGLRLAKKFLNETFIVTSGDILRQLNIPTMVEFHNRKKAMATLQVYKRYGPDPKSLILFDKQNRIISFRERPKPKQIKENFVWANGSFYIFEPEIINYIPSNTASDFGKDIFPKLLRAKKSLFAYPTSDYFIDIGNLDKLEKARRSFQLLYNRKKHLTMKISSLSIKEIKKGKLLAKIPELYELNRYVENNPWHDYDNVFTHTLTVLKKLRRNTKLAFIKNISLRRKFRKYLYLKIENNTRLELLNIISLLHDIAKPLTFKKENDTTICPGHEQVGAKLARKILLRLGLGAREIDLIEDTIKIHGYPHSLLDRSKSEEQLDQEFAELIKNRKANFNELILLALSDTQGSQLNKKNPADYKFRVKFYHRLLNSHKTKEF